MNSWWKTLTRGVSCWCFVASAWTVEAKELPLVVVSIRPLALLVQDICQSECRVQALIPAGPSEHHWEPGSREMIAAKSAIAAVGIGLNLDESWFDRVLPKAGADKKLVPLLIGKDLNPVRWTAEGEGSFDPHVWFDPLRMAQAVPVIVNYLSVALPHSAAALMENSRKTLQQLNALHEEILKIRNHWSDKPVLMIHDALGYWVARYQIKVESLGGANEADVELSAKIMAKTLQKFKNNPPQAILVERKDGAALNLSRELKTPLIVLDLAANAKQKNYYDWLRSIARTWDEFSRTSAAAGK